MSRLSSWWKILTTVTATCLHGIEFALRFSRCDSSSAVRVLATDNQNIEEEYGKANTSTYINLFYDYYGYSSIMHNHKFFSAFLCQSSLVIRFFELHCFLLHVHTVNTFVILNYRLIYLFFMKWVQEKKAFENWLNFCCILCKNSLQ